MSHYDQREDDLLYMTLCFTLRVPDSTFMYIYLKESVIVMSADLSKMAALIENKNRWVFHPEATNNIMCSSPLPCFCDGLSFCVFLLPVAVFAVSLYTVMVA